MAQLTRLFSLRALALMGATACAACGSTVGPVSSPSPEPEPAPEPHSPSLSPSPSPGPQSRLVPIQLAEEGLSLGFHFRGVAVMAELFAAQDSTDERWFQVRVPEFLVVDGPGRTALPFLLDSDADAIRFAQDGLGVLVNGARLAVDLASQEVGSWLELATAQELAGVRGVRLAGEEAMDLSFLRRLAPPATLVVAVEAYGNTLPPDVLTAILAARPAGLSARLVPGLPEQLETRSGLRMLQIRCDLELLVPILPDLEVLELLRSDSLAVAIRIPDDFEDDEVVEPSEWGMAVDAGLLAEATSLRVLVLEEPVRNAEQLSRLENLRALQVNWGGRRDLGPLLGLAGLKQLMLTDADALADISDIVTFQDLTFLWISGHNPNGIKGITRLAELPRLRQVVVDEDLLGLEEEQWDALRAARPDLIIEGFCVGSWLILLVLGLGVAAGLGARRHARLLARRQVGALPG